MTDAARKAYWANPNDETFRAAAEAIKAANGGKWPTAPKPETTEFDLDVEIRALVALRASWEEGSR